MAKRKPKRKSEIMADSQVEASSGPLGPAKRTRDFVRDRFLDNKAGSKKGWRRRSPIEATYQKGQINRDHYNAADEYATLFATTMGSGRDSIGSLMSPSRGDGLPFSQEQFEASRKLLSIDSHMGANDRTLIRMVCGEGYWPSEAMQAVFGTDYSKATVPRFKEAMQALVKAMDAARRGGFKKFDMAVRP